MTKMSKKIIYKSLIVFSMFLIIIPLIIMIVWSFTKSYMWPSLMPQSLGMRGWSYVVQNKNRVLSALFNSIYISFMTTIVTVIICIPCAKVLAFENFRGKKIVEALVFSPVIIPPVSIGMGLNVEFIKLGLARTYTGIILVSIVPCIPYAVRMIKEVFLIIGDKYIKQAYVLGASKYDTFRKIVFPMILPGIISSAMMCYIVAFSQYFLVYLIGGGKIITFTMDMFPFIQSGDRMIGSIYGVIFVISTFFSLIIMEYCMKKIYKKELDNYMYL